jgi:protein MpaA
MTTMQSPPESTRVYHNQGPAPAGEARPQLHRHSVTAALAPLERIIADSASLSIDHSPRFESRGKTYELPRYRFIGQRGGDEPIRVGLFAGVHGDEPEGVHALVRLLGALERQPELAEGYSLFVYPLINPTGFEDNTRHSRSGLDLNREFWTNSAQPEVKWLEQELASLRLHGLVSLHTDDTSHGFYGYASGAALTQHLLEPALRAAGQFVPRNTDDQIDGFTAHGGIIRECHRGVLSPPPGVRPRPFEIVLESPRTPPEFLKEAALLAAVQTILAEYRKFIAYAPNL